MLLEDHSYIRHIYFPQFVKRVGVGGLAKALESSPPPDGPSE